MDDPVYDFVVALTMLAQQAPTPRKGLYERNLATTSWPHEVMRESLMKFVGAEKLDALASEE